MNRRDQQGDIPEKSSSEATHQTVYIRPRDIEAQTEDAPEIKDEDSPQLVDSANFAYQLLLLQQRLVAYEQLHLEEIAELRQEIEQLRRAFLQETNPELRVILPIRDKE